MVNVKQFNEPLEYQMATMTLTLLLRYLTHWDEVYVDHSE